MTGSLQVKNGKYYIILNVKDENGNRKQKWIATDLVEKSNKRNAEKLLRDTIKEYEDKKLIFTKKIMFSDFMAEWLKMMKNTVKPNTYDSYRIVVDIHVIPYFKQLNISLQDLEPVHIQKYYNTQIENGLSPNTVLKHHANIHKALDYALSLNLIAYNPSNRVMLPKKQKFMSKYYNEEQLKQLFEITNGTALEAIVFITANYGLRRSEALGLKWENVDFKNNTINICHTAVKVYNKVLYDDSVKTKSSYRTLPLTNNVAIYLKNYYNHQLKMKNLFGSEYQDNDYICKFDNGKLLSPDYVSHKFKDIVDSSILPSIRFHDLRHSSASLLLDIGFTLKDIQEWLGHGDIATTANIYAHLQYKAKVGMADKINEKLNSKNVLEKSTNVLEEQL